MKSALRTNSRLKVFLPKIYVFLILVLIGYIFLPYMMNVKFIQDDAFTSLRYVRNFLDGKGLVFNKGERVEGFTNFLWVMILSGIGFTAKVFRFHVELENAAQFLSIFFGVTVLLVTYFLSRRINFRNDVEDSLIERLLNETVNLLPVFLVAYSTTMIYWSVSGMETSLFVTLTLLSVLMYLKKRASEKFSFSFVGISVLNTLVRPEGMFFFFTIILYEFAENFIRSDKRSFVQRLKKSFGRKIILEITFYIIPILLLTIFRLFYYGYPLPNTFYAKTEFTLQFLNRGLNYFFDFASAYLIYGLLLLTPVILFTSRKLLKEVLLLYFIVVSWIIVVILLGGDVLPINRFFLLIMPLIFILAVKSFHFLIEKLLSKQKAFCYLATVLLSTAIVFWCVQVFHQEETTMLEKRSYEMGLVTKMKIYADWVNHQSEIQKRKMSVAMSTIGAFSYFSNARVIDIVGLTDAYIAHHPKETPGINNELPLLWKERHYNADYVLSLKPDYIIFPAGAKPSAFAECAIFVQPEFQKTYYTQIFYSERLNQLLPVFTKRADEVDERNQNHEPCNVKFIKHYILANNYFLGLTNSGSKDILNLVLAECDSISLYCPMRLSDALTIKGLAYYHAGALTKAEEILSQASELDLANAISHFYLQSIYAREGKMGEAARLIAEIKKYSPDAFPNFVLSDKENF